MEEHEETIKTYDKIAQGYSDTHFGHFWVDEFDYFKEIVPGKKVVDIGCGAGRDAAMFVEHNFDYTGIDASEGMLKVASDRVKDGRFIQMDFYNLELPPESFDGFWAAASILHIPKKKTKRVLNSLKDVLRPGGVGFITIKEKKDMDEGMIEQQKKYGGAKRYFAFYTTEEFKKLLEDVRFEVLKTSVRVEDDKERTRWLNFFVKKPA